MRQRLSRLVPAIHKRLVNSGRASTDVVTAKAKEICPKKSGDLANSGESEYEVDGNDLANRTIFKEFYGLFVEYATIHTPAQPFARPAADAERENTITRAADAVRQGIKDAV